MQSNVPVFGSRQEASSRLIETIQKQAQATGITISGKEFLDREIIAAPDNPDAPPPGFFEKAAIKVTLNGVKEKELFAWMHAIQQPKSFLGITRLQIVPANQGKTVNCEVDIAQFYREGQAPKLTKAN